MNTLTRRIVAVGVAAATAVGLAGCAVTTGNPTSNGGGDHKPEKKDEYRVAYIARAQADSFAAWLANEMQDEAAD